MRDGNKKDEILTLVNEKDKPLGFAKRGRVHTGQGMRHRAFQVTVFNAKGRLLLARRHQQKLFGGLWEGTVCSHPLRGEDYKIAILREVEEEIGVSNAKPERIGEIVYQVSDGNGMAENEYCALFRMTTERGIKPDPKEVNEIKWVQWHQLQKDIQKYPEEYAPWFLLSLSQISPE